MRLVFALLLTLIVSATPPFAYPPGEAPPGHNLEALTTAWWTWHEQLADDAAILDRPGACAIGQSGDIWFLAGTTDASPARRACTVPSGKTLFFPLITIVTIARRIDPDCEDYFDTTNAYNDTARDLFASVDGQPVAAVAAHRVGTPHCFTLVAPGGAYGVTAASDGYWLAVRPLPKGHHVVTFGGRLDYGDSSLGQTRQDNRYELDVE